MFCVLVLFVLAKSFRQKKINKPSVSYRQAFTPILYFQSSSSQSDSRHFHFNLSGPFWYSFTASATDLRERFLLSDFFYLTLLPDIWHNLLLSRLPWEPAVLPWRFAGPPTEVRNADPAYLFVWITQCLAKGISR